jgi:hypothetical protein
LVFLKARELLVVLLCVLLSDVLNYATTVKYGTTTLVEFLHTLVFLMAREFLVELLCVLLLDVLKYATTVTSTSCSPGVEKL